MGIFPYPIFASALALSTQAPGPAQDVSAHSQRQREADGRSGVHRSGPGCPSRKLEIPLPTAMSPPQQHERGSAKQLYAARYLLETLVRRLGAEDGGGHKRELALTSRHPSPPLLQLSCRSSSSHKRLKIGLILGPPGFRILDGPTGSKR